MPSGLILRTWNRTPDHALPYFVAGYRIEGMNDVILRRHNNQHPVVRARRAPIERLGVEGAVKTGLEHPIRRGAPIWHYPRRGPEQQNSRFDCCLHDRSRLRCPQRQRAAERARAQTLARSKQHVFSSRRRFSCPLRASQFHLDCCRPLGHLGSVCRNRRAWDRAIRAEYATIARERL